MVNKTYEIDEQPDTCYCTDGHEEQRTTYPLGTEVKTTTPIYCHDGIVPLGTRGEVVGHCDDGRAYVRFAKPADGSSHTFHFPEQCFKVLATPATAPACEPVSGSVRYLRSEIDYLLAENTATLARVVELEGALRGLLDCETNLNGCSGIKLLDAVDAARAALAGKVVG